MKTADKHGEMYFSIDVEFSGNCHLDFSLARKFCNKSDVVREVKR